MPTTQAPTGDGESLLFLSPGESSPMEDPIEDPIEASIPQELNSDDLIAVPIDPPTDASLEALPDASEAPSPSDVPMSDDFLDDHESCDHKDSSTSSDHSDGLNESSRRKVEGRSLSENDLETDLLSLPTDEPLEPPTDDALLLLNSMDEATLRALLEAVEARAFEDYHEMLEGAVVEPVISPTSLPTGGPTESDSSVGSIVTLILIPLLLLSLTFILIRTVLACRRRNRHGSGISSSGSVLFSRRKSIIAPGSTGPVLIPQDQCEETESSYEPSDLGDPSHIARWQTQYNDQPESLLDWSSPGKIKTEHALD